MLSPDSLPGCHRDARFEPIKGQAPAAPAPSNKYALPCALQCPWDRFFTFHFLRFEPSPMTPMYFTAAWFPSDGCSLQSLFQSALIGKLVDHKMMGLAFFSLELSRFVGPCSSDGGDGSCLCHALDQMPSSVESPRRSLPDMVTNMISTQQHSHNIYYIMGCQNMLKRPWFSKVLILAVILVAFTDGAVSGQAGSKLVSKWIAFFSKRHAPFFK